MKIHTGSNPIFSDPPADLTPEDQRQNMVADCTSPLLGELPAEYKQVLDKYTEGMTPYEVAIVSSVMVAFVEAAPKIWENVLAEMRGAK